MIVGKYGDHYSVEFTLEGDIQMRYVDFEILKHHDVEQQLKDKIGAKLGVSPDKVWIYHALRGIK